MLIKIQLDAFDSPDNNFSEIYSRSLNNSVIDAIDSNRLRTYCISCFQEIKDFSQSHFFIFVDLQVHSVASALRK